LELPLTIGIEPKSRNLEIFVSKEDIAFASKLFAEHSMHEGNPVIALAPGGAVNPVSQIPQRRWHKERFAKLANEISKKWNAWIIIIGGPSDIDLVKEMSALIAPTASKRMLSLAGHTTIKQTAAVLQKCHLLVSNDSAPVFIAAAVGTPTITIFGPQDPHRAKTYGEIHETVWKQVECAPCYNPLEAHTCTRFDCMDAVSVQDVLEAVERQLSRINFTKNEV